MDALERLGGGAVERLGGEAMNRVASDAGGEKFFFSHIFFMHTCFRIFNLKVRLQKIIFVLKPTF